MSKSGTKVQPVKVECLGHGCELYRPHEDLCSLFEIPDVVDRVSAVGASSEEAVTRSAQAVERTKDDLKAHLAEWETAGEEIHKKFDEVREEVKRTTAATSREAAVLGSKLRDAVSRQERLLDVLDEEVRRIREEVRVADADRAAKDAEAHCRRGDLKQALYDLEKAWGVLGGTPRLLNTLGCVHLKLGRLEEASAALRACLQLDPACSSAHVNLGLALLLAGDRTAGEASLREGLRIDPTSGAGWNSLGNHLFLTGRRLEAVDAWLRAVRADPGQSVAWENLRRQHAVEHCPFEELVAEARAED